MSETLNFPYNDHTLLDTRQLAPEAIVKTTQDLRVILASAERAIAEATERRDKIAADLAEFEKVYDAAAYVVAARAGT